MKRSQLAVIFCSSLHLRRAMRFCRAMRWRCLQWFMVAMMSASIILAPLTPALAGINDSNADHILVATDETITIDEGGTVTGATGGTTTIRAGGTVNATRLLTWGGELNVESGDGPSAVGARESRLTIGQQSIGQQSQFVFTGAINVIAAERLSADPTTPHPLTRSILHISSSNINNTFTLGVGGRISIAGIGDDGEPPLLPSRVIVTTNFENRGTITGGGILEFLGNSFHAAGGTINADVVWGAGATGSLTISNHNGGDGAIQFGGSEISLARIVQDAAPGSRTASLLNTLTLYNNTTIDVGSQVAPSVNANGTIPNTVAQLTLGDIDVSDRSITKTGAGVLHLMGTLHQTDDGKFTIQKGWVTFGDNDLGAGSIIFNGVDTRLRYTGGAAQTLVNAFNFGSGGTLDVVGGRTLTLTGVLTVGINSEMRKEGVGTLVLSGDNTSTRLGLLDIIAGTEIVAGTEITAGTVQFSTTANLGPGDIRINNNATLAHTGIAAASIDNNIQFNGAGTIDTTNGWTFGASAILSGSGTIAKAGAGTMTFNTNAASDTKNLGLRIEQGTVSFSSVVGFVKREICFNQIFVNNIAILPRPTLSYTGTADSITSTIVIEGTNTDSITGTITKVQGTGIIDVIAAAGTLTLNSEVKGANGSLIKAGAGTLVLTKKNTFTGAMEITAGTLRVTAVDSLATARGLNFTGAAPGGTFDMQADQTLRGLNSVAGVGTINMGSNTTLTLNLQGTHNFGGTLNGDEFSKLVISANDVISANPLIPVNQGLFTLSFANAGTPSFIGGLHLKQGTQTLDLIDNLPNPTLVITSNWTPGDNTTVTFDLNHGSQMRTETKAGAMNPLTIEVQGAADFDTNNVNFQVIVNPQVTRGDYWVGRINASSGVTYADRAPVVQSLLQTTRVKLNEFGDQLNVYTEVTGFDGDSLRAAGMTLSENQYEAANNLERVRIIPTTANHGIMPIIESIFRVDALTNGSPQTKERLQNLLTQLSGDVHANAMFLAQNRPWQNLWQQLGDDSQMYFVGGEATSRGELLRGQTPVSSAMTSATASRPLATMNRMWITPTYSGATFSDDDNARGGTIDRLGFQMGMDRRVRQNATVGGFLGFNNSRVHQGDDRVQASDLQLGVYATGMLGYYIEVRSMGGIGFQSYESTRTINNLVWLGFPSRMSATGKANGYSAFSNLEVSRPLFFGLFIFRPTLGLDIEYGVRDPFSETGDAIALHVARTTAVRVATRVGFSTESGTMKRVALTTRLFGGAQFGGEDMRTDSQFVGVGAYPYQSIRAVQTGVTFIEGGVGTRVFINDSRTFAFRANYDGMISRYFGNHAIGCGLQWSF